MAFMTFNKKKAEEADKGFGLITPGEYEVFVTEGEHRSKAGQTPNINLQLVIRSDVEQDFKGRKLFHTFWLSEASEEKFEACMNMIQSFTNKLGVPDGVEFESHQQWINFILGKPVKATVATDKYEGKERSIIKYFKVSDLVGQPIDTTAPKSNAPQMDKAPKEEGKNPYAMENDGKPLDISDDDLPF